MERGQVIGCDVGGTFTDLVLTTTARPRRGEASPRCRRRSTTSRSGVLARAGRGRGRPCRCDSTLIVHGTTTTTNAVLERQLCKHRPRDHARASATCSSSDAARGPHAYGMTGQFRPIIPRDLRLEVPGADGWRTARVIRAPRRGRPARRRPGRPRSIKGCEARGHPLPALLLATPRTSSAPARSPERDLAQRQHHHGPRADLGKPRVRTRRHRGGQRQRSSRCCDRYVAAPRRQALWNRAATTGDLLVMNGNGGMVSARHRRRQRPPSTVMSGPASGVMAAAYTGRAQPVFRTF